MILTDINLTYSPLPFIKAASLLVKSPPKKSWIYGLADGNFEVLADRHACINLLNFGENVIMEELIDTPIAQLVSQFGPIINNIPTHKAINMWYLSVGAQSSSGLIETGSSTIVAPLLTGSHSYYIPNKGDQAQHVKYLKSVAIDGDFIIINGNHSQHSLYFGITLVADN